MKLSRFSMAVISSLAAFSISIGVASAMTDQTAHAAKAGPRGPRGLTGLIGPIGPTGLTGAQGLQGVAGPIGPAGVTGAVGPAGPAGPQGAQGLQGPPGTAGNNSTTEFTFKGDLNTPSTTVSTLDGVKLLASCNALGRLTLTAVATNVAAGILTERDGTNFQIIPRFGTANTTGAFLITPLSTASSRADVQVHYVSNAGHDTTISIAAVDLADGPNGLSNACIVFGTATTF